MTTEFQKKVSKMFDCNNLEELRSAKTISSSSFSSSNLSDKINHSASSDLSNSDNLIAYNYISETSRDNASLPNFERSDLLYALSNHATPNPKLNDNNLDLSINIHSTQAAVLKGLPVDIKINNFKNNQISIAPGNINSSINFIADLVSSDRINDDIEINLIPKLSARATNEISKAESDLSFNRDPADRVNISKYPKYKSNQPISISPDIDVKNSSYGLEVNTAVKLKDNLKLIGKVTPSYSENSVNIDSIGGGVELNLKNSAKIQLTITRQGNESNPLNDGTLSTITYVDTEI